MINHGAKLDAEDYDGSTPFDVAYSSKCNQMNEIDDALHLSNFYLCFFSGRFIETPNEFPFNEMG